MSDNHGNTPAAWTAVFVSLVGFTLAAIGVIYLAWPLFWAGVVLVPVAVIAGVVVGRLGIGAPSDH